MIDRLGYHDSCHLHWDNFKMFVFIINVKLIDNLLNCFIIHYEGG